MCVNGEGFAIFGIAISIAAYNIAKLYFNSKKPIKTGFDQELFDRFGLTTEVLDRMIAEKK